MTRQHSRNTLGAPRVGKEGARLRARSGTYPEGFFVSLGKHRDRKWDRDHGEGGGAGNVDLKATLMTIQQSETLGGRGEGEGRGIDLP